jgi:tetratricopeptide (TPR) repeat protein
MESRCFFALSITINNLTTMTKLILTTFSLFFVLSLSAQLSNTDKINLNIVKGKYKEAIQLSDSILEMDSVNEEVAYCKALALNKLSREKEALKTLAPFIKSKSRIIDLHILFGQLLYDAKMTDSALQVFLNVYLFRDATHINNGIWLSKCYEKLQEWEKAEKLYYQLLQFDADNTYLLFRDAMALVELKKGKEAIPVLRKALALDNEFLSARYLLAKIYLALNKDEIALQHVDTLQKVDSLNTKWFMLAGHINAGNNHYFQAYPHFKKATTMHDIATIDEAMQMTGVSLYNMKKYTEALPYLHYNEVLIGTANSFYQAGRCYEELDSIALAEKYYEKAYRFSMPTSFSLQSIITGKVNILVKQGNFKEALQVCNDFLVIMKGDKYESYMIEQMARRVEEIYVQHIKDISGAVEYYQNLIAGFEGDKGNPVKEYFQQRITALKEQQFFEGKQ